VKNKLGLYVILLFLSSCSTAKFNEKTNCSPRALEQLSSDKQNVEYLSESSSNSKNFNSSLEIFSKLKNDFKSCYQGILAKGNIQNYNVCVVVVTGAKGELPFIDIDDNSKGFDFDLWTCMMKSIKSSGINKIKSTTILQPIILSAKEIQ